MCDHGADDALADALFAAPPRQGLTRRGLLGGAALLGAAVFLGERPAAASSGTPRLAGPPPLKVATHVHGSYSEHAASWAQQYANAEQAGIDVVVQTDHDHHMLAEGLMTSLRGSWAASTTGSTARDATATLGRLGAVTLAVESATASPSTSTLTIEERTAWGVLRTGIAGQSMTVTFGACALPPGGTLDVVVTLSLHPSTGGRPAGQYAVAYRFGPGLAPGLSYDGRGLRAVVTAPLPLPGSQVVLTPVRDVATAWPDLLALDNSLNLLAFSLSSPAAGAPAAAVLRSVTFARTENDPQSVLANVSAIRDRYAAQYGVLGCVAQELSAGSNAIPHLNPMFAPLELVDKSGITPDTWREFYEPVIANAVAAGGAVSWNHVFGPGSGCALTPAEVRTLRQETFAARYADRFCGATLLEVYTNRVAPMGAFLDLGDTFARYGLPVTLIGAHDDHVGRDWRRLGNGWTTGVHASSLDERSIAAAMNAGRAFAAHLSWQGSSLDTLAEGDVPMGGMRLGRASSRTLAVDVAGLPAGAYVEMVVGPVDSTGVDPGTVVAARLPAEAFGGDARTGTCRVTVDTPLDGAFVRPQVRNANNVVIGVGQPTWWLPAPPEGGMPADRVL